MHNEELNFESGFSSFEAEKSQTELMAALDHGVVTLEVFHNDRVKIDRRIGKVDIELSPLKDCEFVKTKFSYVRVFDSFHSIMEVDGEGRETKIGELRVKLYLEDLGPSDMIINDAMGGLREALNRNLAPNLHFQEASSRAQALQGNVQADDLQASLEELEMKVVWELETWKKTEEAKFLFSLKQREVEFLSKLSEDWRRKEVEKDKFFRNYEASLLSIESKLKAKALELQKREGKVMLLETELKTKIEESAREIIKKNDQIKELKAAQVEVAKKQAIVVKNLEKQLAGNAAQLEVKDKEVVGLRTIADNSQLTKLKKELAEKDLALEHTQSELRIADQLKVELKELVGELQEQMRDLKGENERLRATQSQQERTSLEAIRMGIGRVLANKGEESVHGMMEELQGLKKRFENSDGFSQGSRVRDSYSGNTSGNRCTASTMAPPQIRISNENPRLRQIMEERARFIEMGMSEDDILVQELDNEILIHSNGQIS